MSIIKLTGRGAIDGVPSSSGEIGEVLTFEMSKVTQISPVLGTFYDGFSSIVLPRGNWLVSVKAIVVLNSVVQSGSDITGAYGSLQLTDSSNNKINTARGGFANTAINTAFAHLTIPDTEINIAEETIYKVRFGAYANSGTPTISTIDFSVNTSEEKALVIATRIS